MLSIKNLYKKYNKKLILNGVSCDIKAGEVVVLLGESGVGKSTVLRILNNLESFDDGAIAFNGKPLDQKDVGMVFQDFNLFNHMTIQQNIATPLQLVAGKSEQEATDIAQKLLSQYNLEQKANLRPSALSGGQRQRVAFARTLAMQPKIICLDEPTSALDPMLTSKIAHQINLLSKQGLIVIIATHDTELIKQIGCRINLMEGGKIIESAESTQLEKHPEKYPCIKNFTQGGTFDTTKN